MNWAELIKKLRNKLLITQMELGEMLGVSFSTVNRWEMGCHEPTMKLKRKIAELCKKNGIKMED
jgi:putative transcriptional regulator